MLLDDYMYVCFSHMYSQHDFIILVFITISNQLTISVICWSVLFISPSRCAYLKHLMLALIEVFPSLQTSSKATLCRMQTFVC